MTPAVSVRQLLAILLLALAFVSAPASLQAQQSGWLAKTRLGQTVYFFFPDRTERYDLTARAWLPAIGWPTGRGPVTAAWADPDGLFAAYGQSVYRYALDGSGEQHLLNLSGPAVTGGMTSVAGFLVVRTQNSAITISKATNTLAFEQSIFTAASGLSAAYNQRKVFARTTGSSPSDIQSIAITASGAMTATDSPYHGDLPGATSTWVTGDENAVFDSSGTVYQTGDLRLRGLLGRTVADVAFAAGSAAAVALTGNRLTSYSAGLFPEATRELGFVPDALVLDGADIVCFSTRTLPLQAQSVARSSLLPLAPGPAVAAAGLAYVPDDTAVDKNGVVLLLSKAQRSIFRWDTGAQKYLGTIPLLDVPSHFAYSPTLHRIYVGYASGLVRRIDLETGLNEVNFALAGNQLTGLVAAGNYCLTVEGTNSTGILRSFAADGTQVSSATRYLYSLSAYQWSEANQKIYNYDSLYLQVMELNANGVAYPGLPAGAIGATTQFYQSSNFPVPFRISPDGLVLVNAGGALFNARTLVRSSNSLANPISDAVWLNAGLRTARTVNDNTVLQQWSGATYAPGASRVVPGTAIRLLALPNERLVGLTLRSNGVPYFQVVDTDLNPVVPPTLTEPAGLSASLISASVIRLRWADTPGATGFTVQRRQARGDWNSIGSTGLNETEFADPNVAVGQIYEYRVVATNGALVSPPSVTLAIGVAAPQPPTDLIVEEVGTAGVRLRWAAASGASGYRVERKQGEGAYGTLGTTAEGVLTYVDNNPATNRTYTYRVLATNVIGASAPSNTATALIPAIQPGAPYISVYAQNETSIRLAFYTSGNPDTVVLERLNATSTWSVVANVPASDYISDYLDTGLQPGTTYSYRARAVNSAGSSPYSYTVQATTRSPQPPEAVSSLTTRMLAGGRVRLTWSAVAALGYRLQRQTGEGPDWTELGAVGGSVTSFEDAPALRTRQSYRVIAFNGVGEASPSQVSTVTTFDLVRVSEDSFDPGVHAGVWQEILGGVAFNGGTGFGGSNVLWFGGDSTRWAITAPRRVATGGYFGFRYRAGNQTVDGNQYWNDSETDEYLIVEFSTGNGWEYLELLPTSASFAGAWRSVEFALPSAALGGQASFRIRQLSHSGAGFDTWAIDDFYLETERPAAPAAPGFVFAGATSDTQIAVTWEPSANASSYRLERALGPNGPWSLVVDTYSATHHTDVQLQPATWYAYRLVAQNAGGSSAPSLLAWAQTYTQFAAWQLANFGATNGAPAYDADGVATLAKFAFGLPVGGQATPHPVGGATGGLPAVWRDPATGRLQLEFVRRRAASNPGIGYRVQLSEDLATWQEAAVLTESVTLDATWERVRYESPNPRAREVGRVLVSTE